MADLSTCSTSLVALLDDTSSMNNYGLKRDFWKTQVEATAAAISDPDVIRDIIDAGGIALKVMSFNRTTREMVPWIFIHDQASAEKAASMLRQFIDKPLRGFTDIGQAVDTALDQFVTSPCTQAVKKVDVSTDGVPTGGATTAGMARARDRAIDMETIINGIAVPGTNLTAQQVAEVLRTHQITPGGFVIESSWDGENGVNSYAVAIKSKLRKEIARDGQPLPTRTAAALP